MLEPVALSRGFGEQAGQFLQAVLDEHGIVVHGGDELDRFEGADGRVTRVITKSGLELEADAVVIGVGAVPDVMLARTAGLELGDSGGVVVDSAPADGGPGDLRRRRHRRVRERRPRRRAHPDRALGRRVQPGQDGRAQHARRATSRTTSSRTSSPICRTGPRSSTSARPRVGPGVVRGSLERRRVRDLLPAGRSRQGGALGRPLRRPRARPPAPGFRDRRQRPGRRFGRCLERSRIALRLRFAGLGDPVSREPHGVAAGQGLEP